MMVLVAAAKPKVVLIDFSSVFDVEYTALKRLAEGEARERKNGISVAGGPQPGSAGDGKAFAPRRDSGPGQDVLQSRAGCGEVPDPVTRDRFSGNQKRTPRVITTVGSVQPRLNT